MPVKWKNQSFIDSVLKGLCSVKVQRQIHVAADEIFLLKYLFLQRKQICRNGDTCGGGTSVWNSGIAVCRLNPLTGTEPDVTLSAEERKSEGSTFSFVKKRCRIFITEYRNGQNILTY